MQEWETRHLILPQHHKVGNGICRTKVLHYCHDAKSSKCRFLGVIVIKMFTLKCISAERIIMISPLFNHPFKRENAGHLFFWMIKDFIRNSEQYKIEIPRRKTQKRRMQQTVSRSTMLICNNEMEMAPRLLIVNANNNQSCAQFFMRIWM